MCHLAIEKAIKSLYTQVLGQVPPKTHNLVYLALKTDLEFPEEWELFLQKLTRVSVPTRYPEDLSKLLKQYNRETAHKIIGQTRELMKWLQSKLSE
jgi:HEPN domain-containing protein